MTEDEYIRYIAEFNAACAGDGTGFGAFFDHWYAPDAVFEYIPAAKKNAGRAAAHVHPRVRTISPVVARTRPRRRSPAFPIFLHS